MAKKEEKKTQEEAPKQEPTEVNVDYKADAQRLQAEFDNYKKRVANEQITHKAKAEEAIIKELLPINDNFTLALKNHQGEDEFTKGVELIYAQLQELLSNHHIQKIEANDQEFDPNLHEALMTKEADKPNIVLEVLQDGYMVGEKVLRPAKVIVSKNG